jgi:alanyl-tRNA synthetase
MASVASVVCDDMGDVYPELLKSRGFMTQVIDNEETRFAETLETGLRILDEKIRELKEKREECLPGDFVFKLYDTYGLPVDIVQDVVKEQGAALDREGYRKAREEQRQRSKSAHRGTVTEQLPDIYRELLANGKGTSFSGYSTLESKSDILALVTGGQAVDSVHKGWEGELVAEVTPFYAESGGQKGDTGIITGAEGLAQVVDTVKRGDLIVHLIKVREGSLHTGEKAQFQVTEGRRMDIARNHTATHLLHAALRQVLGDHVKQSGSLVAPDHLRFDFTHFSGVSQQELQQVEDLVNQKIRADLPVMTEILSRDEAVERGATALFGEKYGDEVRVVNIPDFSMELCGGTHLERTGQAGFFKITSESSISAGLRRIEACTGRAAVDLVHGLENTISDIAFSLKCPVTAVKDKVDAMAARVKQLEKELQAALASRAAAGIDDIIENAREINGIKVVASVLDVPDAKALREAGDRLRDRLESGVIVLGAKNGKKALLLCVVTKDIAGKKCHAGKIIKEVAAVVGGGGGGRPDMAQAGGSRPEKLEDAVRKVYEIV